MNEGPQAMGSSEINALLGRGSEFEGKLTFEGKVQIDGKFTGEVSSEGTLVVGSGAHVKAEISVDTVIIKGELIGNIRAKEGIELHSSARLRGNMHTAGLTVEKGAVFDGNCVMEGRESSTRHPPQPAPQPSQSIQAPEE